MLSRHVVCAAVGGALALASALLPASDRGDEAWLSLLDSAIGMAAQGDSDGASLLQVFLRARDPWRTVAVARVEDSDLLVRLGAPQPALSGMPASQRGALLAALALAQGAESRSRAAKPVVGSGGAILELEVAEREIEWVTVVPPADAGRRELVIGTDSCGPDITAFEANAALPAMPQNSLVRMTENLALVDVPRPIALRVRRGDCEEGNVQLRLSWQTTRTPVHRASSASVLAVAPERIAVVDLTEASAQPIEVATEFGFVYEVKAASPLRSVDPSLTRSDPQNGAAAVVEDDDSGWQLGARLPQFVGTGRVERVAVLRVGEAGGPVAVLVQRRPVPRYDLRGPTTLQVDAGESLWIRVPLGAGRWRLRTTGLSAGLDPALEVLGPTGRLLGANDDLDDNSLAAEVRFGLETPSEVYVRVSADERGRGGSLQLEAAAAERRPVVPTRLQSGA